MEGSDYYQEQPSMPDGLMPTYVNPETTAEQLRYMLDPEATNEKIENYLKGKVYDFKSNKFVKKFRPLMNDVGINRIMFLLSSHTDAGTKLTHIDTHNAREIVIKFSEVLHEDLIKRHEEYELDYNDIPLICTMIENQVFCAYCRGEQGIEKRFLKGMLFMNFNEGNMGGYNNNMAGQSQRSGGFLNNLFNRRKY